MARGQVSDILPTKSLFPNNPLLLLPLIHSYVCLALLYNHLDIIKLVGKILLVCLQ